MGRDGTLFGLPADQVIRTGLGVTSVALSTASLLMLVAGAPKASGLLAVTGGLLGASLSIAELIRNDQDRHALDRAIAGLEAQHA